MQETQGRAEQPVETSPHVMRLVLSLVVTARSNSPGRATVHGVAGDGVGGTMCLCWSVLALSANDDEAIERRRRMGIGFAILGVPLLLAILGLGGMAGAAAITPGVAGFVLLAVAIRPSKRKQLSVIGRPGPR